MKVHLASAAVPPQDHFYKEQLTELAAIASEKKHTLVDDPESADAILVTGMDVSRENAALRNFPLVHQYPNKVFVYSEHAVPLWLVPGVYTNTARSIFSFRRTRASSYASRHTFLKNSAIEKFDPNRKPDLLFSFLGGSTSFVRKRLLNQNFNRPDIIIENTSAYHHWNLKQPNREEQQRHYVEISMRSKFALCPRGVGTGIIRLFEMMEMGIVPVVMSDGWVPPRGPNWDECAIFVRERDVARLPEILEAYEPRREMMEKATRAAWESYFAPDKQFNSIIDAIAELQSERIFDERLIRLFWPFIVARRRGYEWCRKHGRTFILRMFSLLKLRFPYALNRPPNPL